MTAIIWGINGQDGFYLENLLGSFGYNVTGITRSELDITSFEEVRDLVKSLQPDYIFHFAANSTTSHAAWRENHDTISTGTLHILEAVLTHSPGTKVFLSGSGLQFVNNGNPINERDEFATTSIYSVSRIHMTYLARYYRQMGVKVYTGYFFNHDSPLRSERHINKKIIEVVKRISAGSIEMLEIGDVTVKKEFGFAGDMVKAVWTLVRQDQVFESVIGTGEAYSIADWLEICFSNAGLSWKEHVIEKADFKAEYRVLVSDPSTIRSLGWAPETSIFQLAKLMST